MARPPPALVAAEEDVAGPFEAGGEGEGQLFDGGEAGVDLCLCGWELIWFGWWFEEKKGGGRGDASYRYNNT